MRNISIDWSAVERDYREGRLSLRQLALKHRCSHSTIANVAGRHGWMRDGGPFDIGTAVESEPRPENVDRTTALME